jgi:hypothetical protein
MPLTNISNGTSLLIRSNYDQASQAATEYCFFPVTTNLTHFCEWNDGTSSCACFLSSILLVVANFVWPRLFSSFLDDFVQIHIP